MIYRRVAQLAARRAHNPKAAGSSPAPATSCKPRTVAAVDRRSKVCAWILQSSLALIGCKAFEGVFLGW